jgi:hypothetical protein
MMHHTQVDIDIKSSASSRQVDSMPDTLKAAKVSQEGFLTFAALWRNVHSLAVATDLHYNSRGFFRKADFKVCTHSGECPCAACCTQQCAAAHRMNVCMPAGAT